MTNARYAGMILALCFLPLEVSADKLTLPKCDNNATCINEKNFFIQVMRMAKRGNMVTIQLEYVGKRKTSDKFYVSFGRTSGYAALLDAAGNEFKIMGENIESFRMGYGEKKVISFRFRGDEKKRSHYLLISLSRQIDHMGRLHFLI